ncbi:MAG: MFS transporter [Nocardioides sp.]|uniref:MFS transporter n=1 Tax=Nocardioides sp. TaxID=35761 RepID=UPI0039E2BECF
MSTPTSTAVVGDPTPSLIEAAGRSYFPIALVARLPYAMMVVGVLTLVVAARDSIALGGVNSAAVGLGAAVFGPLVGAAADRFGQRRALLVGGIGNSLALLAMSAVAFSSLPDVVLLTVAFLVGATAPQVSPMSRSRLVGLITTRLPEQRQARVLNGTMAYESAADETIFIVGPVVVGLLATTASPVAPVIGAAVLTLLFVTSFALHPTARTRHETYGGRVVQAPAHELLRARVLVPVLGALGVGMFFGATLTSLTAFVTDLGHESSAGLVYGAMGVGSTVLALSVALFPVRFSMRARWATFAAVILLGGLGYAAAPDLWTLVPALVLAGVGIGPTLVTQYSLAADRSPRGRSATVMTMLGSAIIVGQSLASALTGILADRVGTGAAMWLPPAAAAFVVLAAIANLRLDAQRRRLSRTRCWSTIGVPTNPNSSRSRRSMKRS